MDFNETIAKEIIENNGLSKVTLRVWRKRGKIPKMYFEKIKRVYLTAVLKPLPIETAINKYGNELGRLINTRTFKGGQKDSYYSIALISLCRECETYKKTGKLS